MEKHHIWLSNVEHVCLASLLLLPVHVRPGGCRALLLMLLELTPPISSILPSLYFILQTPLKNSLLYILFLSNSVLYISSFIHQKSVLRTYFASNFFTYVFIIPLNIMYIFYFYLIYYL